MSHWQYQSKAIPLLDTTFAPDGLPWVPSYPDRILRLKLLAGQHPAFTTGSIPSGFLPDGLVWRGVYPDALNRLQLLTAAQLALALPTTATNPAVPDRAWASIYPDRIAQLTLPPAGMPFFFLGPLVPIPNPQGTALIEDRVLIGQNQSIETPAYPSIGGSSTWS